MQTNLNAFDISDVYLIGAIPTAFGLLTNVFDLRLNGNSFSGI